MNASDRGNELVVGVAREADEALHAAMAQLVPQLDPSASPPTRTALRRMLASPGCRILVARAAHGSSAIVGMLTLSIVATPSGTRAWIDDVVVDAIARGRGVGARLVREALRLAEELGAQHVALTSRPDREAANRLYQRLGFERRDTNVYRYVIATDLPAR